MSQVTISMCDEAQKRINEGSLPGLTRWELYQLLHMAKCFMSFEAKTLREQLANEFVSMSPAYIGDAEVVMAPGGTYSMVPPTSESPELEVTVGGETRLRVKGVVVMGGGGFHPSELVG